MGEGSMSGKSTAIRGPVLTYTGDPFKSGLEHTMVYQSDAIVAMANGLITHFGSADSIRPQLPPGRNGITCGCIYCTVYPQSVDVLLEEAEKLGMRLVAGKVMMDRNAPEKLLDTPKTGYDDSKALIKKWHNRGRLLYAITPRFAPTSTREQLEATGVLCKEHPDCYMQTHVSENKGEVAWVKELFPERKGYLDVYDHYSLCRPRGLRPRHPPDRRRDAG